MTGHDGNVSPPARKRARRSISGSSAVPGGAGAEDGGRGMNRANEPAIAGGSSATSVVENAPPGGHFCLVCSKEFASRQAVNGHMRMHPKEREGASILLKLKKLFPSQHAVSEHMPVHNSPSKLEKEMASILPEFGQIKSDRTVGSETKGDGSTVAEGGTYPSTVEAQREKIPKELDLNKEPPEDDEKDDEDYGGDNGGA